MISPVKFLSAFLLLGLLIPPHLASAKVVPLLEYTNKFEDKSTGKQNCSIFGAGWSEKRCASNNEEQKQAMIDGTLCYKCSCSAKKYPYLYCPSSYFNQGASCTANEVTQYASCSCKSPWRPSTDFVSNVMTDFNYNTGRTLSSSVPVVSPALSATDFQEKAIIADRVEGGAILDISANRDLVLSNRFKDLVAIFNANKPTASDVNGNVLLTCYDPSLFSCKSGSKLALSAVNLKSANDPSSVVLTVKDEGDFIRYNAKGIMKTASASGNIFCTTDVSFLSPLFSSTSRPADKNKCADYLTGTTKYSPYKTFGYFDGNCSTSGDCVDSSANQDCVVYAGTAVDTYNPSTKAKGSITCKYVNGCMSGLTTISGTQVICGVSTVNTDTYFEYTPVTAGSIMCKKVTGCKSPYQKAHLGATNTTDYSKDGNYNYDVKKVSSGNGLLVCRKSQGCAVPTYDYSCSSKNWNGYLALWANTASK